MSTGFLGGRPHGDGSGLENRHRFTPHGVRLLGPPHQSSASSLDDWRGYFPALSSTKRPGRASLAAETWLIHPSHPEGRTHAMTQTTSDLSAVTTTELTQELLNRFERCNRMVPMGSDVVIYEPWTAHHHPDDPSVEDLPCIKPYMVTINGTDVGLIARDGIEVDINDRNSPATVTLTLLIKSLTVGAI
jgi:hypothetical protein